MKHINFCNIVVRLLLAVFAVAGFAGCVTEGESEPPKTVQSSGVLTAKCLSYGYNFAKEEFGGASFEILCNGKEVVFRASADYISFTSAPQKDGTETDDELKPRDMDGDGTPDLVVQETNGNCCVAYTVISLGDVLREHKLENVGADFELVDLDGDGKFEIKTMDTTFFENSEVQKFDEPAPQVFLESKNGRYEFSQRFMKDVSPVKISDLIDETRRKIVATGGLPPLDKNSVVEWIYHGQGDAALKYLDAVYDGTYYEEAKNEMADEIVTTLLGSPHWEEISRMNRWVYAQPDGELACPEFAGRRWLVKTK